MSAYADGPWHDHPRVCLPQVIRPKKLVDAKATPWHDGVWTVGQRSYAGRFASASVTPSAHRMPPDVCRMRRMMAGRAASRSRTADAA